MEGWQVLHPQSIERLPHYTSKITQITKLPPFNLRNPLQQPHPRQVIFTNRQQFWLCRYKKIGMGKTKSSIRETAITRQPLTTISNPDSKRTNVYDLNLVKTSVWCATCHLPLCDTHGCFNEFHHF